MKSRALDHKSDKSCNHRKDLFLLWAFLLFQGCKLSYWWYLGWTHSSLKECILLHFHGRMFRCYGAHFVLLDAVLGLDPSCLGLEHSSFWTPAMADTPSASSWFREVCECIGHSGDDWHRNWCARVGWHGTSARQGCISQTSPVWSDRLCDQCSATASPDPPLLSCWLKYRHVSFLTAFFTLRASL